MIRAWERRYDLLHPERTESNYRLYCSSDVSRLRLMRHYLASSFLDAWMLTMARGWSQARRRRALLACVPGERHTLGLVAFGLVLRDLGWGITYLGADTPLAALERAAAAVEPEVVVLSTATASTFGAAAGDLEVLAQRLPVVLGGAGADDAAAAWLVARRLPADPVMAGHALVVRESLTAAGERAA